MNESDLYAVLQVAPDASSGDIRRAYRALLRSHHPDLNPDGGGAAPRGPETDAEQRATAAILHAYVVLGDAERRADYDRNSVRRVAARRNNEPGESGEHGAAEPGEPRASDRTRPGAQRRPHPHPSVPSGRPVYLGFDDPLPADAVRLGERPPSSAWDYHRWIVFDR